jgi:hypothetical protein
MIRRCYDPTHNRYYCYGANGITICDTWLNDFQEFVEWSLSNGYDDDLSIDRKDCLKPYEPENCRWIEKNKQSANRGTFRNNKAGVSGVCSYHGNKYRAYITRGGTRKHLGVFETLEQAVEARKKAEDEYNESA